MNRIVLITVSLLNTKNYTISMLPYYNSLPSASGLSS